MTVSPFAPAKPRTAAPRKRAAGGDDQVERDGNGRPRILTECEHCQGSGKIPSEKRPGNLNKCLRCAGEGSKKVSYTRATTYIDVLEDTKTLMHWKARMVLLGAAMDPGFLHGVASMDSTDADDRKAMDRLAEAAADFAGASERSKKGSFLHELTEMADRGEELPHDIEPEDWLSIMSYAKVTHALFSVHKMEKLVVNDELKVAGTPDRIYEVLPDVELIAPDGEVFTGGSKLVGDTKTGRVDLGGLKMCMQMALYAKSPNYVIDSTVREPVEGLSQKWAVIMHVPAGQAKTDLYWADLTLGWQAVLVARDVREMRRLGRKALTPLATYEMSEKIAA